MVLGNTGYRSFPLTPNNASDIINWARSFTTSVDTEMFWLDDKLQKRIMYGATADRPTSVGSGNLYFDTDDSKMYIDLVGGWAQMGNDGSTTDHGGLSGLTDDDHTQYYNQTRGDARYSQLGHNHDADYADIAHIHMDEESMWEFFIADSQPKKDLAYVGGLLDEITLYDALDNKMYTKSFTYDTNDILQSITLVRNSDNESWLKELTYDAGKLIFIEVKEVV